MDKRFSAFNKHLLGAKAFREQDNHLQQLIGQPYVYHHPILNKLPLKASGIYTFGGGRQIGKTTLLKQWISLLLEEGVKPESIVFFAGEIISDYLALTDLLEDFTATRTSNDPLCIIIDEVTYIKEWERGIKFAAEAGYFRNCIVLLTGSDLTMMQAARMSFPGRRGREDTVDFHMYSLSFKEFLLLKNSVPGLEAYLQDNSKINDTTLELIYSEFNQYLIHGGYLTAINDMARDGKIAKATLKVYSDWIRGDMAKRNKQERYLKEIILAIIKRYNKQVTWHALADALSIDSHKTVSDYCELLSTMDALFIQKALLLDKLIEAPKKARKLTFTDPFIYHSLKQWLEPASNPYEKILSDIRDPHICADLVEAIVSNQYRRHYPTYYICEKIPQSTSVCKSV